MILDTVQIQSQAKMRPTVLYCLFSQYLVIYQYVEFTNLHAFNISGTFPPILRQCSVYMFVCVHLCVIVCGCMHWCMTGERVDDTDFGHVLTLAQDHQKV